jgi:hypothetical protein
MQSKTPVLLFEPGLGFRIAWFLGRIYHGGEIKRNDTNEREAKMADCRQFICDNCDKTIEAWSDGNPYYIDGEGKKQYAYHPDHEKLDRCIGNDSPHICLSCGREFKVDSRSPITRCPKCESTNICDMYHLDRRKCPYCKQGIFAINPDFICLS